MSLSINRSVKSPGILILSVGGSLDAKTSPDLEIEVNGVLSGSARALIFDFEFLDYISSAGIRVVMMAHGPGNRFIVYLPIELKIFEMKIAAAFKLPEDATRFDYTDEHYSMGGAGEDDWGRFCWRGGAE